MVNLSKAVVAVFVAMSSDVQALAVRSPTTTVGTTITSGGTAPTTTIGTTTKGVTETKSTTETANVVVPVTPTPTSVAIVPVPIATGLSQIARFEDGFSIPRSGLAIDTYMDIYWQGMSLAKTEFTNEQYHQGLLPNSPPNYASFSSRNDVTIQQGTPEMTIVYLDSTVTSFDLHEFFYGCAAERPMGFVPVSCEITITGFNSTGDKVQEQTFDFKQDGRQQQMPKAVADGFSGVQTVTFAIGPDDNDATAFIDSVDYTVFSS